MLENHWLRELYLSPVCATVPGGGWDGWSGYFLCVNPGSLSSAEGKPRTEKWKGKSD